MFHAITKYGVTGKAINNQIIDVSFLNPRDFSNNKHKSIDDRPYGGGPGMLMSCEPLYFSIKKTTSKCNNFRFLKNKIVFN